MLELYMLSGLESLAFDTGDKIIRSDRNPYRMIEDHRILESLKM